MDKIYSFKIFIFVTALIYDPVYILSYKVCICIYFCLKQVVSFSYEEYILKGI